MVKKKEEYRDLKPYYDKRFSKYFNCDDYSGYFFINYHSKKPIIFRNGYFINSPQIKCLCSLDVGYGKKEWGAEEGKVYYILKILEKE